MLEGQMALFDAPVQSKDAYGLPRLPYAGEVPHVNTDTSIAAAKAMRDKVGPLQRRVILALYQTPGLSDEGLDRVLGVEKPIRPRRRELVRDGFVMDSGDRCKGESGLFMTMWTLTAKGEAKARELNKTAART